MLRNKAVIPSVINEPQMNIIIQINFHNSQFALSNDEQTKAENIHVLHSKTRDKKDIDMRSASSRINKYHI